MKVEEEKRNVGVGGINDVESIMWLVVLGGEGMGGVDVEWLWDGSVEYRPWCESREVVSAPKCCVMVGNWRRA